MPSASLTSGMQVKGGVFAGTGATRSIPGFGNASMARTHPLTGMSTAAPFRHVSGCSFLSSFT